MVQIKEWLSNLFGNRTSVSAKESISDERKQETVISVKGTVYSTSEARVQSNLQRADRIESLSDLKVGSGVSKQISEEYAIQLRKLGDAFFKDCDQILMEASGNTPPIRLAAITRFGQLLEAFRISGHTFADHTSCTEPGYLSYYCLWRTGGICLDGGCYSDEPDEHYYLNLRRITPEEYNSAKAGCNWVEKGSFSVWYYRAELPGADQTEVVMRESHNNSYLYLKNPMGILGYFEIEHKCK